MSSLDEISPRLGALSWISSQLFELEGQWAALMDDPSAVNHLATHSRHHGWHATLWRDSLPDSPALDAKRFVVPPSSGWARAISSTIDSEPSTDTRRLAILYRVLVPRLVAEIHGFDAMLGGPGDPGVQRIVRLVVPDVAADLHGGIALLNATLGDDEMIEIAASATKTLDQAFRT